MKLTKSAIEFGFTKKKFKDFEFISKEHTAKCLTQFWFNLKANVIHGFYKKTREIGDRM